MPYPGKAGAACNVPFRECLLSIPIREGPKTPSFRPQVTWVISPTRLWEKAQFDQLMTLSNPGTAPKVRPKRLCYMALRR